MTPPTVALLLFGAWMANLARSTALKQPRFKSAGVGETVTLNCSSHSEETLSFYWFKQILGQKIMLVSRYNIHSDAGTLHGQFSNNMRFSLDTGHQKNHLRISDLKISDSGIYHCVVSNLYQTDFYESITVDVQGPSLTGRTSVSQSASGTVPPGGSLNLSCTAHAASCDGQRSVLWFRSSGDDGLGLVYTHGAGSEWCERKPNATTRTCVYSLPMKSLNQSQAGTYYCAVTACGQILFGNGTKVDIKGEAGALVGFLSAALAFANILILSLAFMVYRLNKRLQSAESRGTPPTTWTDNTMLSEDGETLHYAAVRTSDSSRQKRDDTERNCVYSSVKY